MGANVAQTVERALDLAKRSDPAELAEQSLMVDDLPALRAVMDAIPSLLMILNENRQIIFANRQVTRVLGLSKRELTYGKRPGELLLCDHVGEGCHGCGSSEACVTCGAAQAIRSSELGASEVNECRIHQKDSGDYFDLRVSTTPLRVNGRSYTVISLDDISHENRRRNLERIFFHDLLNTLGALTGYAQLLEDAEPNEVDELTGSILRLSDTLAEEVRAQRDLAAAENNDLAVRFEPVNSRELIEQVAVHYRSHQSCRGRAIVVAPSAVAAVIRTDRRLLLRIMGNMLKNALEAIAPGQCATINSSADATGAVTFSVHNTGCMPRDVQLQVFHRAFSTKGSGRGVGTYSMKLLGERYLQGQVWFTSTPDDGTTFFAKFAPDPASAQ